MDTSDLRLRAGHISKLLKTLSSEPRLLVLCQLAEREMSVGELQSAVGLSQSAMSQHLAVLRRDELVTTRRDRQTVYYSLNGTLAKAVIEGVCRAVSKHGLNRAA
jgi:ArsR family transcriptional regulator, virulence genes transcriptional regulator